MNKLKTFKEYIILIGIAALLLFYIIFRSAGNMNYQLPSVENFESENINHITIEGKDVDLNFVKTDGKWYIQPENWEADNTNPKAIAEELAELKIADLISTSGEKVGQL